MNKPHRTFLIFAAAAVLIFGGRISLAQTASPAADQRSFEAVLYVILGSDDATGGELPSKLGPVGKQVRENFQFANYRLLNTYLGRIADNGSLEYKSVSSFQNASLEPDSPSFLEWNLARLSRDPNGKNFSFELFRFGARVPVKMGNDAGKAVVYESVGMTLNRFGLVEGVPTLIGTISLPKTTGTVFLVMSVRPA